MKSATILDSASAHLSSAASLASQPPLRIAVVTETYPPEVNGVARTMQMIVDGLRRRRHSVELVRPRQHRADRAAREECFEELLRPGIPVPGYKGLHVGAPSRRALRDAWRRTPPDVVHIATEGPLGWSALAAARDLGLPVVTDFHTNFHDYSAHYGAAWLARPVAAFLRRFHNRADATLVPTDELAQHLDALRFERVGVVERAVDARTFNPERRSEALRARWDAGPDTPVVMCVSRFAKEKNYPLLFEAFQAMRAVRPDARLVLVGDGPLEARLRRANIGHIVAGRKEDDELAAHYASADVFLFASTTETYGNVTLEAMASGLGIVAFDYAAARRYLRHGESALLAPFRDRDAFIEAAVMLARDRELARSLGMRARAIAAELSWEPVVDEFVAVLRAKCAGATPASPREL